MTRFTHWLAHLFGWNCGRIETWTRRDGQTMVGFRCTCGQLRGVHPFPSGAYQCKRS